MIQSKVKVVSRTNDLSGNRYLRLEVITPDDHISLGSIKIIAETKEGKAFFAKCKEYYLTLTKDCEHGKTKNQKEDWEEKRKTLFSNSIS